MPATLRSRKFLAAFLVLPLIVWANRRFGIGLTEPDLAFIASGIVGWIFGEAHVDAKAVERNGHTGPPVDSTGRAP